MTMVTLERKPELLDHVERLGGYKVIVVDFHQTYEHTELWPRVYGANNSDFPSIVQAL